MEIERIKQIRRSLGITQHELANLAQVSQSLIAKLESGALDPSYSKAKQIINALQTLEGKKEQIVRDIMHEKIISCSPDDEVKDVIRLLSKHAISQIPVIEHKHVIGIITESDVIKNLEHNKKHVRDIMSDAPPVLNQNTKLSVAKELLKYQPLLIISEKGIIKGIVTKADLIKKLNQ